MGWRAIGDARPPFTKTINRIEGADSYVGPMLPMLAAAALFATAVADAELASVAGDVRPLAPLGAAPLTPPAFGNSVTQDQVDDWWADGGAALIAEAVRPRPAMPLGLTLLSLTPSNTSFRFIATVAASTAP